MILPEVDCRNTGNHNIQIKNYIYVSKVKCEVICPFWMLNFTNKVMTWNKKNK